MSKDYFNKSSNLLHLVERQMLLYEERRKLVRQRHPEAPPGRYRFMTISRDIGALGDIVASELAERLKWKVYDKEIVDYVAEHSNVRKNLVDRLDERAQNLVHDSIGRILRMFQGQTFSNEDYHVALIKTLATLAAQEQVIILGHGGAFALQEHPGLHIRIGGSLPVRVQRLSKRWALSLEETRQRVLEVDAERREFIRRYFRCDREDSAFFHLIFNTDHVNMDQVIAAIIAVLEQSTKADSTASQLPAVSAVSFQSSEQISER